ncbi:HPP family protein [Pelomonas aquatica]|jgi:CBS domain-containing membrane protein|uniref:HPP family protein n=1 Tax=Pelomonas aquatica TaxID=431058 RepID=A0A9X4RAE4_9BURK|nr:HPP family protein [Pelomonas aquatica]MCY4756340.1 HPP family protein [Pelomonas aquatica]MDG0865423.1 HPP family protein [Pelomonas aquatica]
MPDTAAPLPDRVLAWLNALRPAPQAVNARERLRVVLGAGLGLLLAGLLSHAAMAPGLPWLVAPLGASAVLIFGVPASPLAQPWAVVGGNTLSALVGIACMQWLPLPPLMVAAVAVALAIAVMFTLRCLHPPGGAAGLLMVLTATHDWHFAFVPVALNSLLLVLAGMAYNTLTGRRYPHAQQAHAPQPQGASVAPPRFGDAELDAVLARYNQVLDVPRDDLADLLHEAELLSYRNRLGGLRCADIMSSPVISVEFGTPLAEAWALLQQHGIKALPVVDRVQRIVGIVTRADFMRAAEAEQREGLAGRLQALLRPSPATHSTKPEVVGQIMSRQVRVASAERAIAELVPLFSDTGHHHIPIVGEQARLVGILTQSDLVKALSHGP